MRLIHFVVNIWQKSRSYVLSKQLTFECSPKSAHWVMLPLQLGIPFLWKQNFL